MIPIEINFLESERRVNLKASWLWIWSIPLLYLPNFISSNTGVGVLEVSDFLMVPLALFLIFLPRKRINALLAKRIISPGIAFVLWAYIGVAIIYLQYDYYDSSQIVMFSFLKVSKFALYAAIPLIISSHLSSDQVRTDFNWAILGCCVMLGSSVFFESGLVEGKTIAETESAFKSLNQVSTCMAIFIIYLSSLLVSGYGSPKWRLVCKVCMGIILMGFTLTQGRGGWIAAIAGFVYMGKKRGVFRIKTLLGIGAAAAACIALYFVNPEFKFQVEKTLFPERAFQSKSQVTQALGIDDGYRLGEWMGQAYRFLSSPFFGAGFYHRTYKSGLSGSGSHNFWLQMFLETGLIGGGLMIYLFGRMWKQSESEIAKQNGLNLPTRSALFTAFIAGLSGEYFYGGLGLFTVLLIYAPLGSLDSLKAREAQELAMNKVKDSRIAPES